MPMQMVGANDPEWLQQLWAQISGQGSAAPAQKHWDPQANNGVGGWAGGFNMPAPGDSFNFNRPGATIGAPGATPSIQAQFPQRPQLPQAQPYQAPQVQPQGMTMSHPMFGNQGGAPHLGGPLARAPQGPQGSPLQAAMRRPQSPTGAFAGNAQGSVVGDMGPDAGMSQGLSPALLAMMQGPQQELGNFSQAPQVPQMQSGSQLPQQGGNRLSALLRAILPGV